MLCRRKCAQIMRLLEPFFPSFPHLFLAIFFARRDNQFQFRGRDRDEKNGDARRQLRVETVELRGVTLFILLSQSWKFIECDGCQLRRHSERLSLIGRGEAFPINGGETEIRAPLQ